jgi:chemotaxis protein methyltransferase CheR
VKPTFTTSLFAIWSAFIRERIGIDHGPEDRDLLHDKLWTRAQEAGFATLLDYYYFLRYDDLDGKELDALTDALVVGESYLFRELEQLEVAADRFIGPAVAERGAARVWSAACAGGEEPLTLAMVLDARGLLPAVQIVASDVSNRALARARARMYSRRAVRGELPPLYQKYVSVEEGRVLVASELAARIEWRRLNLIDPESTASMTGLDAILCRNVLIYFDDETVVDVVARLAGCLRPGGALLVGVTESLLRLRTTLSCEEHGGVFVYRRVA